MVEVRQMSFGEKLSGVLSYKRLVEDFSRSLVSQELGGEKFSELQNIWQRESQPIPENAADEEKYEIAYRNFLQNWVSANNFMGKHQGEDGTKKFMHAAIAGWKRKYARQALALKIIWIFAPKTAFQILAKKLAYELQVFSPFTISQINKEQLVLAVTPCKIADTQRSSSFCVMACQNIIPAWLEAQFNVKMSPNRQGNNCTVTFAHF